MIHYHMTFKGSHLVILVTAALIATVVRLFFYLVGGEEGSYLRQSIASMGMTVVILEVCIVMLRFFTTFQVMSRLKSHISEKYEFIFFALTGLFITFVWTTVPPLLMEKPNIDNDALMYMTNRPFEPVPILVEYASLYVLHHKIVARNTALSFLCMAIMAVIVAIADVKGNANTSLPVLQNPSVPAPTERPQEFPISPHNPYGGH